MSAFRHDDLEMLADAAVALWSTEDTAEAKAERERLIDQLNGLADRIEAYLIAHGPHAPLPCLNASEPD